MRPMLLLRQSVEQHEEEGVDSRCEEKRLEAADAVNFLKDHKHLGRGDCLLLAGSGGSGSDSATKIVNRFNRMIPFVF